jgi:hypothetical protein
MNEEICTHDHCIARVKSDAYQQQIYGNIFWASLALTIACFVGMMVMIYWKAKNREKP